MQQEQRLSDNEAFLNQVFSRHVVSSIVSMFGALASGMANSLLAGIFFGASGLAVMSVVAPFYALFAAFGSLVGVGGSTVTAYALGRDDREQADSAFTLSTLVGTAVPLGVGILCCLAMDPLLRAVGCTEALFADARSYSLVYFLGGFGTSMFYLPYNFLKLVGKLHLLMGVFLGMAASNILLDIFFVKALGMGIEGIAAGTVASSLGTSAVGMAFLLRGKEGFSFAPSFSLSALRSIRTYGTPSALNQMLNFFRLLLMNHIIAAVAGDVGLAAFSVFSALERLSLVVLSGLSQATSPFVSVFTRERDTVSVRRIEKRAHLWGAALILPMMALVLMFPAEICQLFGIYDGEKLRVASNAVFLFAFSLPPSLCCFLMFFYYQSAGFTTLANCLIFCRAFLFLVLPAYLLSPHYGLDAVWLSLTIASASPLLMVPCLLPYYRRRGYQGFLLQDLLAEKNGSYISFAVKPEPDAIIESVDQIASFCDKNGLTRKETYLVRLSMEEMLMSIKDHCFEEPAEETGETMDVRIMVVRNREDVLIILRIRNGGKLFNPIDYYERMAEEERGEDDDPYLLGDALGIAMIAKTADAVHYKTTFGINNLTVVIDRKEAAA